MKIVDYALDIGVLVDEMTALDLVDGCVMAILPAAEGVWHVMIAREGRMPDMPPGGKVGRFVKVPPDAKF